MRRSIAELNCPVCNTPLLVVKMLLEMEEMKHELTNLRKENDRIINEMRKLLERM